MNTTPKKIISLSIPEALVRELRKEATAQSRNLSAHIRHILKNRKK